MTVYKLMDSGVQARRANLVPVQSRKIAVMVGRTVKSVSHTAHCCFVFLQFMSCATSSLRSEPFRAVFLSLYGPTLPSLQGGHAQLLQLPTDRPHLHGLFLPHRLDHRGVQKVVSCKWAERKRQSLGSGAATLKLMPRNFT